MDTATAEQLDYRHYHDLDLRLDYYWCVLRLSIGTCLDFLILIPCLVPGYEG